MIDFEKDYTKILTIFLLVLGVFTCLFVLVMPSSVQKNAEVIK